MIVDDQLIKHKSYDVFELWNCGNFTSDCDDTNSSNNSLGQIFKVPKKGRGFTISTDLEIFSGAPYMGLPFLVQKACERAFSTCHNIHENRFSYICQHVQKALSQAFVY